MTRFDAPYPGLQKTLNRRWTNAVGKRFRGHCFLGDIDLFWGDYWERFNTMQIPLFGEEEYVNTAIEVLNISKNPEDFEKNFEQVNKRRREVLMLLLGSAMWKIHKRNDFPSEAARYAVVRACETGCFQYFLQLLKGDIWGWEADIAEDTDTANAPDEEIPQGTVIDETQRRGEISEENKIDEETQKYFDECLAAGTIPKEWETQVYDEWDETYETPRQRKEREEGYEGATVYIGTTWEYPAPGPSGTGTLVQDDDSLPSTMSPPPSPYIPKKEFEGRRLQGLLRNSLSNDIGSRPAKKRVRFADEEDDDREPKRQKLDDPEPLPTTDASSATQPVMAETLSPIKSADKNGKRPRDDDEGDDDDNVEDNRKRQKLDSPTTLSTPDTSSAEQIATLAALDILPPTQVAAKSTSGKRSRSDDEEDGEDDATNSPKRQRLESPESLSDLDALLSQQIANEIDEAHRRAKKPIPRTRRPTTSGSPNRRSRRSSGQAALWELDGSGRPQSIR